VGVFDPVVQPSVLAMLDLRHELAPGGAVGAALVGYDAALADVLVSAKALSAIAARPVCFDGLARFRRGHNPLDRRRAKDSASRH
jgi:hypothetical protein